jgi:photosystem II stability/assembly factor-like uncharacterized protein
VSVTAYGGGQESCYLCDMGRVLVALAALIAAALAVVCSSAQGGAQQSTSHGPDERGFSSVAVDPRDGRTVYVVGGSGVFKSSDGGEGWRQVDSGLGSRYVVDLAIDQHDPATLYAATAGGVFKSTNAAASWRRTGLEQAAITVLIDPRDSNTLYAAADVNGVFKSGDGGETWHRLFQDDLERVYALAINPKNPSTVYAGAGSGVFRSYDGEHFSLPVRQHGLFGDESGDESKHRLYEGFVTTLAINPREPSTLYLGCDYGVCKTTNAALSWRRRSNGLVGTTPRYRLVGSLALDALHPRTLYAGLYPGGVFKTTDGGRQWRLVGLRDKGYVLALAIDPQHPNTLYAGTSGGYPVKEGAVYKSINGGRSWHTVEIPAN